MTSKGQRKNRGGLGARRYARARAQDERVQRSWEAASNCPMKGEGSTKLVFLANSTNLMADGKNVS